jgi:hypothetical protein
VTVPSPDQPQPFIFGDQALSWFMTRRGGGTLYDQHMTLIRSVFGNDVPVRFRAAVDPTTSEPTVLIIDIDRSLDDEESWQQLVRIQQALLELQPNLAGSLRVKDPFRNIIVNLSGERSSWSDFVAELESEA